MIAGDGSRLVGFLQTPTDDRAVLGQSVCDIGLAGVAQVSDRPVELLERVIGGPPVAVGLA